MLLWNVTNDPRKKNVEHDLVHSVYIHFKGYAKIGSFCETWHLWISYLSITKTTTKAILGKLK